MSDLLQIGASGARAYRAALSAVGENITNAETPGFARRSVVLKESGVSGGTNALYLDRGQFGGVVPTGVTRAWDDFKAADSRLAGASAGRSDARVRWLSTLETSLDDGQTGVGQRVTAVFTAGEALATDPDSSFSRRAFLASIDSAAGAFRTTADALKRTSEGVAGEATATVDQINGTLDSLAKLNVQIRRAGTGTSARAQLSDERDRLLDQLSDKIEIDVKIGDDGAASVTLPRSGGLVMVSNDGLGTGQLMLSQGSDGRLSFSLFTAGNNHPVTSVGGALAGLVETSNSVADRRGQLDALGTDFATKLNTWSAAGVDRNGDPGTALLAFTTGNAAATLAPALADRDPATVAAASVVTNADGMTTRTANGNLLTLSGLRGDGGTEAGWSALVASQSQVLASAKSEQTTTAGRKDAAYAARDAVSGVDLDYEASELLRFQQAYSGAAKIIQVARETMQTILEVL